MVLYVQDVSAAATHWSGIFLVESDPDDVSRLTVAKDAIVIADREQGKLELHLNDGSMHESSINDAGNYTLSAFGQRDLTVAVGDDERCPLARIHQRRTLRRRAAGQGGRRTPAPPESRFIAASGASRRLPGSAADGSAAGRAPRRGSRAGGFLLALLLICGYYVIFTVGAGLARDGLLPAWLGIWAANIAAAACGPGSCSPASAGCRTAALSVVS